LDSSVTATVLFTDLVGSTALASRLGARRADDLRRTHFDLLRAEIAETQGIEVKNLGDGLMVAFSSARHAIACAIRIQQSIARHNRRSTDPLAIRIGLSTGEAAHENGDYFGTPVVEAARLCAIASGGQILTTDLVRRLVAADSSQSFVDLGPKTLKGLPEPIQTVEVTWEPAAAPDQLALPTRVQALSSNERFGFHGRADELTLIADVGNRAFAESKLTTLLLCGEAGVGKSTLLAQDVCRAHVAGVIVLFGHCDEELGIPYQPWAEALDHLLLHRGTALVEQLAVPHRTALARLLPARFEHASGTGTDPVNERLILFEAVRTLLELALGKHR
jgi:class 3 adenylate cyclase